MVQCGALARRTANLLQCTCTQRGKYVADSFRFKFVICSFLPSHSGFHFNLLRNLDTPTQVVMNFPLDTARPSPPSNSAATVKRVTVLPDPFFYLCACSFCP